MATSAGPIRVLDLRDTYEIGGPGKTILETFRAMDPRRFELHLGVFLTRGESPDTPFTRAARDCGMPVHLIEGRNQFDPRLIWRTARLVRRLGIDIVHAHEVKSDAISYLASFLVRTRVMTTLHGWIGNSPRQRLFTAIDKRLARRFDRVVVVSALMRDEMAAAGVGNGHLRLVHNGIVLSRYRPTGSKLLAEITGTPGPGPVLASVGRLSAEKGHADLIDALAIVRARGHAVTAVLVGDGPERARLIERIRDRQLDGTVHLPGYLEQPQRILEETDLAVLPSHTEGLPNAALEAMAMGVPVLATAVGGTPEVITDGVTGRLVPSRSPAALADAIEDFVLRPEPWRAMAGAARAVVQREFDFEARTRRMEAIYAELLAEGGR
jgi:glycosyltransferase involved in cell wall biosynthesis